MTKKEQQAKALRGSFPKKKNIDGKDVEQTTKKVYKKDPVTGATRKTSIDLDELTFKRLKYIAMMESTSMKDLITRGVEQVVKSYTDTLPNELK